MRRHTKSNGFGSNINEIIVLVPEHQGDEAALQFGAAATELPPEGQNRVFLWNRKSTRRGDDETVVFDLGYLLTGVSWDIDWSRSRY